MTKTEYLLSILGNGGDAPDWCCVTKTQALLLDIIERVNNLEEEILAFTPITNNEIDQVTE